MTAESLEAEPPVVAPSPIARSRSAATPRFATAVVASVVLLPAAVGHLVSAIVKSTNPSRIDVSDPLASLAQITAATWIVFGAWFVVCVFTAWLVRRRNGARAAAPLWIMIGLQVLLVVVIVVAQAVERGATGG